MSGLHRAHGFAGPFDRLLAQLGRMGIAGGFVGDRPQAEPLHRVEAGVADPTVVEGHAFRLAVFQKQFAI